MSAPIPAGWVDFTRPDGSRAMRPTIGALARGLGDPRLWDGRNPRIIELQDGRLGMTKTYALRDDGTTELRISYTYHPGQRLTWHSPACEPSVEIDEALTLDGQRVTLTDAEEARISRQCIEEHEVDGGHPDPDTARGGHDWLRDHREMA